MSIPKHLPGVLGLVLVSCGGDDGGGTDDSAGDGDGDGTSQATLDACEEACSERDARNEIISRSPDFCKMNAPFAV